MLKIKTIKSELTPTSIEFKCVIYGEDISKKRKVNFLGNEGEFSWTEETTLENSDKTLSISYPISEKAYHIMKKVYSENDLIDAVDIFSSSVNFLPLTIYYDFEHINSGTFTPIGKLKNLNINISEYNISTFFVEKFQKLFPNHDIHYSNLDEISIYFRTDKKMIGFYKENFFNFFDISPKYNLETKLYYHEQEDFFNDYTVLGFVNKSINKNNIQETDIEEISVNDYIQGEIDRLNNG